MVDGALSQKCYLRSVDATYERYKARVKRTAAGEPPQAAGDVKVDSFDFMCMHSPYNKLVQKGFARLLYGDFLDLCMANGAADKGDAAPPSSSSSSSSASAAPPQPGAAASKPSSSLEGDLMALAPQFGPAALSYEAGLEDKALDAA